MNHNKIVDLVHICFINILLTQFLTDGLINIILFKVGHLCICLGTLGNRVRDDRWYLWVREGFQCLGNNIWLKYTAVGFPKIPLHILHHHGKLFQGS